MSAKQGVNVNQMSDEINCFATCHCVQDLHVAVRLKNLPCTSVVFTQLAISCAVKGKVEERDHKQQRKWRKVDRLAWELVKSSDSNLTMEVLFLSCN